MSPKSEKPNKNRTARPSSSAVKSKNARATANSALSSIFAQPRPLEIQAALDKSLKASKLSLKDTALATELTYGVTRHFLRLQFLVRHFLKKPEKMPLKVQLIMLQAAHELTNLDRVPAYASVDWAVGTIRKLGGAGMAGAANAVLRRIADLGPSAKEASFYRDGPGGQTGFLSRFYSCPEWIVGLWIDELGLENAEKLLIAQNAPPPVGLRLNAKKNLTSELYEELNSLPGSLKLPFPSLAFETTKTALMDRLPALLESGLLSRQSAAVMDILANLDFTTWPEPIFDACAGRGGKTFALLETGLSKVVAADLNFQRLKELLAESKRLDLLAPPTIRASATQTYPLNFRPRTILIDAPCSSLGVISRRPDVKWRMTETDMPKKAGMQAKMLQRAVDELEPGGRVVFITCTVSRLENEAHLDSILKNNKNCRLLAEARTPFDSPLKEFFYGFVLQK